MNLSRSRIASFACALLLLSCSISSWAVSALNVQPTKPIIKIAVPSLPQFFSPYADTPLEEQFAHLFFEPLVRWGTGNVIENRLVSRWEKKKEGVYRFYLKKNILFHSGNKLTSRDVIWSFQQMKLSKHDHSLFLNSARVKRINNYTVDIYSSLSQNSLFDLLTNFFILDARYYKKYKIAHNAPFSIVNEKTKHLPLSGTGPFKIQNFNKKINLKVFKNPYYWEGDVAQMQLNFILIKSPELRVFALLADDVTISESITSHLVDTIHRSDKYHVVKTVATVSYILTLSAQKGRPLADFDTRKHLQLALNQRGMVKHILENRGTPGFYFSDMGNDCLVGVSPLDIRYDSDAALRYFSKFKGSKKMSLLVLNNSLTSTKKTIRAVTNMLSRVGIELTIVVVESESEWNLKKDDFDLTLSLWQSNLMDHENLYKDLYHKSHQHKLWNIELKTKRDESFVDQAFKYFSHLQANYYFLPLFSKRELWATDKKYNLEKIFSINGIPYWNELQEHKE
jgi:peptide/nickel transport system substrate-binding protein